MELVFTTNSSLDDNQFWPDKVTKLTTLAEMSMYLVSSCCPAAAGDAGAANNAMVESWHGWSQK